MADFNEKKDALKVKYDAEFDRLKQDAQITDHVNILGNAIKELIDLNKSAVTDSELFKITLRRKLEADISSKVVTLNIKLQELENQLNDEKAKVNANAVEIERLTVEINSQKQQITQAKDGIRDAFTKVFSENNINDIRVDEIVNNVTNGIVVVDQAGGYFYLNTGRGIKKNKSRKSKKGGKSLRRRSKKVVRKQTKSKSKRKRRYRK